MERQLPGKRQEDVVDLGEYFAVLHKALWKILLLTLAVGVLTAVVTLQMPNIYTAATIITPAGDEGKQAPALGNLASIGIFVGGPSKVEDLETLFRSNDLTVRVFTKYDLWPFVFADRLDPRTGKPRRSWMDRLPGRGKDPKPPGDWDAIRAAQGRMKLSVNRKAGTLSISFESPSAEGSAEILKHYLEEGKSRLQEEAFGRAEKNKKFIQDQIGRTLDALTRDRLYSLYGQEVEREMLARNRDQFGFRIIDSPRVPDRKSRPARTRIVASFAFGGFLVICGYFLLRKKGVASKAC